MKEDKRIKVYLFGNGHYMFAILNELISHSSYQILGLCTSCSSSDYMARAKHRLRNRLGRYGLNIKDTFFYSDPFSSCSVSKLAKQNNIDVSCNFELGSSEFFKRINLLSPDIIIVAGFNKIIPDNIIKSSRLISLNVHPSFLPKYRGGTPTRWMIYHGENEVGVTVHELTAEVDAGDIIYREKIDVDINNSTWGDVEKKIMIQLPAIIKKTLLNIVNNDFSLEKQNESESSYHSPLHGESQNISWNDSAVNIERLVRAIKPKSGGLAFINNKKICVWTFKVNETKSKGKVPGSVLDIKENGNILIQCGVGTGEIAEVLHFGKIYKTKISAMIGLEKGDKFKLD